MTLLLSLSLTWSDTWSNTLHSRSENHKPKHGFQKQDCILWVSETGDNLLNTYYNNAELIKTKKSPYHFFLGTDVMNVKMLVW